MIPTKSNNEITEIKIENERRTKIENERQIEIAKNQINSAFDDCERLMEKLNRIDDEKTIEKFDSSDDLQKQFIEIKRQIDIAYDDFCDLQMDIDFRTNEFDELDAN